MLVKCLTCIFNTIWEFFYWFLWQFKWPESAYPFSMSFYPCIGVLSSRFLLFLFPFFWLFFDRLGFYVNCLRFGKKKKKNAWWDSIVLHFPCSLCLWVSLCFSLPICRYCFLLFRPNWSPTIICLLALRNSVIGNATFRFLLGM